MTQTYWFFLALDYLFLNMISFNTIENYMLDRYASPIGIYYPLYSEIFSIESILLYMIIGGAALAMMANHDSESRETSPLTGYLAILFAVLAVPAKLMTRNLIELDTAFFAFVMFFSSLLLYGSIRNWLEIRFRLSLKEFATLVVVLTVLFWFYEPWNSPSLKLTNAIKEGNTSRFAALARSYPQHLQMNRNLLDTAFARPNQETIKTIVESGNTSVSYGFMNLEIFNPTHIDILAYLQSKGVDFANMDMLRNAVSYSAVPARPRRNRISGPVDKNYPVLRFLLKLYNTAPEEKRKQRSENSGGCGWDNLVSIAAAAGDADLMAFLVDQGFAIDEEVYQALALNKHIDKPAIQAILNSSRFVAAKPDDQKTETAAEQPAKQTATETFRPMPSQVASTAIATRTEILPTPAADSVEHAVASLPATAGNLTPVGHAMPESLQLRLEADGLDLILTSGAAVKSYRENRQNIFHYLAYNWRAPHPDYRSRAVDFAGIFHKALQRKIDLNTKDKNGLTPLWLALKENNLRAFIRFLEAGADRSALNAEGATMIEFCSKNNRKILLSLLSEVTPHEK
ncbi:MAG: hypothetical protein PHD82_12855 [Candidatus Riflebacteria bacterium]|nr:hypothetical protein [Candidatus Riflebacteria bacterium]